MGTGHALLTSFPLPPLSLPCLLWVQTVVSPQFPPISITLFHYWAPDAPFVTMTVTIGIVFMALRLVILGVTVAFYLVFLCLFRILLRLFLKVCLLTLHTPQNGLTMFSAVLFVWKLLIEVAPLTIRNIPYSSCMTYGQVLTHRAGGYGFLRSSQVNI